MKTAAIVLNTPLDIADILEKDVICADAGFQHLKVQIPLAIVGDFDSIRDIPQSVKKIAYPVEKNESDGQLAVAFARDNGFDEVVIYGALGGRIEHVLGNIGLLKYAKSIGLNATIREKFLTITLEDKSFSYQADINTSVSVFAYGGDVTVINSRGLYYPLENLLLTEGSTRGISNITTATEFGLDFSSGNLLVIRYSKRIENLIG